MIKTLILKNFKRIKNFNTPLEMINVLVGANNSGKSSVLQGIYFTIMAEVVRRRLDRKTVPQEKLLYLPTLDFSILRNDSPYTNYSGATSCLTLMSSDGDETFTINLSKGRNYGNISIETSNNNKFRQAVTSYKELFCAYTPGLSGIPYAEKLVGKAVLRNAAANGDANLYLRNIIYYISQEKKLSQLNSLIQKVFPKTTIKLHFNPDEDINIGIDVYNGTNDLPLELCGTGLLQVIQIMAYNTFFTPKLLLLDEPDEHLHPNNQILLCKAIELLVNELGVQVILSTHSRHIISALEESAKFIWLKDGKISNQPFSSNYYNVLSDLGALDSFDGVIKGVYKTVVLTEDTEKKYIQLLLKVNGFPPSTTLVCSYKTCSQLEAALIAGNFIKGLAPNCKIIIHRDRDFMTDPEVQYIVNKIKNEGFSPWITKGSDIESYFVSDNHIANVTGKTISEVSDWIQNIINKDSIEIQHRFETKRAEIKQRLYVDNKLKTDKSIECPSFETLFGKSIDKKNVKGKYLMKKINTEVLSFAGKAFDLLQETPALQDANIQNL